MKYVKLHLNGKSLKAILVDTIYEIPKKVKVKKNDKVYESKTRLRILHIYIKKGYLKDYFIIIPLSKDQLEFISDDEIRIKI